MAVKPLSMSDLDSVTPAMRALVNEYGLEKVNMAMTHMELEDPDKIEHVLKLDRQRSQFKITDAPIQSPKR